VVPPFSIPISVLLAAVVLTAAWTDARSRSIPNWLTAGGIAAGFAVNITVAGIAGGKSALAGFGIAAGVYALFYILRAVGGGDLKLMAAIGAISGPAHWFSIFLGSALLGGVMAVCVVVWSGRVGRTLRNLGLILAEALRFRAPWKRSDDVDVRSGKGAALPHALAIAGATLFYLVATWVKT
jgi:prepilin peptidase CpaA